MGGLDFEQKSEDDQERRGLPVDETAVERSSCGAAFHAMPSLIGVAKAGKEMRVIRDVESSICLTRGGGKFFRSAS